MRKITDNKELQQIELEILQKIHDFCEEHKLRYSLCGGTLLGAIRHKGFIPWDDDVDIFMPRPDYEKFCEEFQAQGASVHTYKNDKNYVYPFAKVYDDRTLLIEDCYIHKPVIGGVYVDVFPVDGYLDDKKTPQQSIKARSFWGIWVTYKNLTLFRKGWAIHKQLALLFFRSFLWLFPCRFFLEMETRVFAKYDYETSPFRGCTAWGYGLCEIIPAHCFDRFIDVEFEGRKFKALAGWENYLRAIYHDYMQLPPPEKRVTHHIFKAYWKD